MSERILRLPAVLERTGLSSSTVYRLAAEGRFPEPLKLSPNATGWRESEVEGWLERRPRISKNSPHRTS